MVAFMLWEHAVRVRFSALRQKISNGVKEHVDPAGAGRGGPTLRLAEREEVS